MNTIKLEVAEAKTTREVGRGVVGIDAETTKKLDIMLGDTVKIVGKRVTTAKITFLLPEDSGLKIIRMDRFIRTNCGAEITDTVAVSKAKSLYALGVTLAPVDIKISVDEDFVRFVRDRLIDCTVSTGDILAIMMLGHMISFKVANTVPSGIVKISPTTNIVILGEPEVQDRKIVVRLVIAKDNIPIKVSGNEKLFATATLCTLKDSIETPYALAMWFMKDMSDKNTDSQVKP